MQRSPLPAGDVGAKGENKQIFTGKEAEDGMSAQVYGEQPANSVLPEKPCPRVRRGAVAGYCVFAAFYSYY